MLFIVRTMETNTECGENVEFVTVKAGNTANPGTDGRIILR